MRRLKDITLSVVKSRTVLVVAVLIAVIFGSVVYAESYPGGGDNGKTSRIKQTSNDLATLGFGSTSNVPDWGADWNRIVTAGKWVPQGDIEPSDVKAGKKFYNGSRTEQTGEAGTVGPCTTQLWSDTVAQANAVPATQEQAMIDNCVITWPAASPVVEGDDKKDPITGLVWSHCLRNVSGVIQFSSTSTCTTSFSWDNSGANNTGKTAVELCSERGGGWRLPRQKELLQAYIDGSFFALISQKNLYFWSSTYYASLTSVAVANLGTGIANSSSLGSTSQIICVR